MKVRNVQTPRSIQARTLSRIILTGGWVAVDSQNVVRADIEVEEGIIRKLVPYSCLRATDATTVDLTGHLILPGLVNAHDHLEFNLFPRLGNGPYLNCEDWSRDIYRPGRPPLREQLSIPKAVRLWWGGIKSLLSGATTVCHHNPYDNEVFGGPFPVHVVPRYGWAHSLAFEKDMRRAFVSTPSGAPFIVHLGEGTDERSAQEIFVLDELGALDRRTVIVHGVALTPAGHSLRRRRGAALIWCPTSNRFTLGKTLDPAVLRDAGDIALGSDSALTGKGDLLDEIRAAHQEEGACASTVYAMVTQTSAAVLRLKHGEGTLRPGARADLIALEWNLGTPAAALMAADVSTIQLAILDGQPQLFSPEMACRWPRTAQHGLEWIAVDGTRRLIRAPCRELFDRTSCFLPEGIRLVGRKVSA
jgi:cytosine/adenosine deaminase-related metal-dependent hydrolase